MGIEKHIELVEKELDIKLPDINVKVVDGREYGKLLQRDALKRAGIPEFVQKIAGVRVDEEDNYSDYFFSAFYTLDQKIVMKNVSGMREETNNFVLLHELVHCAQDTLVPQFKQLNMVDSCRMLFDTYVRKSRTKLLNDVYMSKILSEGQADHYSLKI